MSLAPDQVAFTLGGIPFGQVDEFGVDWAVEKLTGWGATKSTSGLEQRARASGAWRSQGFSSGRVMTASGKVYAPDADALSDALDRLNNCHPAGVDVQMTVHEAGRDRWATVQQDDEPLWDWEMPTVGVWSIQVASTDWRKFGATVTGSTGLPSSSGGFTFPLSFPFNIPATVTAGQVSLTNPGNTSGPVVLRVDGPVAGPVITHAESGRVIAFSPLLTVGVGEFLLIDPEAQTVLANGQAGRSMYLTSRQWFGFEPGGNTYTFSASSSNGDARLSVEAIESWR